MKYGRAFDERLRRAMVHGPALSERPGVVSYSIAIRWRTWNGLLLWIACCRQALSRVEIRASSWRRWPLLFVAWLRLACSFTASYPGWREP